MDDYVKRSEISEIIKTTIREVLCECKDACPAGVSEEDYVHVKELLVAIKEVGNGDLGDGIIVLRENNTFIAGYRKITGNIGTTVITAVVLAVLAVVGTVFMTGVIDHLKSISK